MWRRTYLRRCTEIEEADLARERQFDLTFAAPLRLAAQRERYTKEAIADRAEARALVRELNGLIRALGG
jgi:hypothetical protein